MAADLPETMRFPMHFSLSRIAADRQTSKYIEAESGSYITIARKSQKPPMVLGSVNGYDARTSKINFDF